MTKFTMTGLALICASLFAGCSSSTDSQGNFTVEKMCTEDDFDACGGDLEGLWKLDEGCVQSEVQNETGFDGCEQARVTASTLFADSEFNFAAGALTISGELQSHARVVYPLECFDDEDEGCPTEPFTDEGAMYDCRTTSSACKCTVDSTAPLNISVDYNVIGTRVEFVSEVPFSIIRWEEADYCVRGDKLELQTAEAVLTFDRVAQP